MSHTIQIPDDIYEKLAAYAAQWKQTPEALFLDWANTLTHRWEETTAMELGDCEQEVMDRDDKEEELATQSLLRISGMFAIGEPGWADRHDEYLAETYLDTHAKKD